MHGDINRQFSYIPVVRSDINNYIIYFTKKIKVYIYTIIQYHTFCHKICCINFFLFIKHTFHSKNIHITEDLVKDKIIMLGYKYFMKLS